MLVAFIPYLTALMGNFGVSLPVVIFYGLSLTITGLIHNVFWLYVAYKYITHDRLIHRHEIRKATVWSLGYPILYFIATGLAFININLSLI